MEEQETKEETQKKTTTEEDAAEESEVKETPDLDKEMQEAIDIPEG